MIALLLGGCTEKGLPESLANGRQSVVLQTDWFPQPEHGGFYQALANGFYEEEGLQVTILPGGPNAMSTQKVLSGRAHFAMNRADTIYSLATRDVPVTMVMATLQHDPQAILLHANNAINSLAELDGQSVMAIPGLTWIDWVEAKYGIKLDIIPHDFGMERFLQDPEFIQQCLLTNEPFYAGEAGFATKVLRLSDAGFDPYHGIYGLQSLVETDPDLVERFVRASIRGWRDFILGDPRPALDLIRERNPRMTEAFVAFSYAALQAHHLVTGSALNGSMVGQLDPERLNNMITDMEALGLADPHNRPLSWFTARFTQVTLEQPKD
ncbi:MAG: hypothetical protein RL648_1110 [Verrucomicrobiota bacterium]